MNILIDISHPGQVHLFKNIYFKLKAKHNIIWTTRDIPIAKKLLEQYQIPYINLGKKSNSIFGKAIDIILQDIKLFFIVKKYKINFGLTSGIALPHVSRVTKMKSFVFDDDDDEAQPLATKYGHPYADVILTPHAIKRQAKNTIYYKGTHELYYLHPSIFKPDERVFENLDFDKTEKYFVLRFVAFQGHHDLGEGGITFEQKKQLINLLKVHGRVFITSEKPIEKEFESYRLPVPPDQIHAFLYYANLFIGDSQTMISEASIMGVPSIKCNSFAGRLSVPNMLENTYELCYSYLPSQFDEFINKIKNLLENNNTKAEWNNKKINFFNDITNPTDLMIWFIENYPESQKIMQENPDFQNQFK
jgi:predicted glycosyltransferase